MYIIPAIPSRVRPGSTRRRLEARVEILDAQVAALRTGLVRTFECADEPVPADLLTAPEDMIRRIAGIEARQDAQDKVWTTWRTAMTRHDAVLDRHDHKFAAVFATMAEAAEAAGIPLPSTRPALELICGDGRPGRDRDRRGCLSAVAGGAR
ncbi:MAG: hypothetical protein ACRDRJ_44615 [Streptosporangiaceae bacterium]